LPRAIIAPTVERSSGEVFKPMPSTPSDPSDNASQLPATPNKKSVWGKAKETLGEVSNQAAKVAAMSATSAAKGASIGKQTIGAASEATRGALEASKQAYTGSKLQSAVKYVDGELDQRGAKKALKDTTGAVVGKLDQVTGKRLVEMLEERLRIQDEYNDILATRLAEALDRIAKLEARTHEH
jgi:hypothetical protein